MGIVFNPMIGSFDFIREYLTKTGTVLSPIATGDSLAIYIAGITVPTDGLLLENTTLSTVGATVQYSPRIRLKGSAFDSDGAVSVFSEWTIENKPVSGTTVSSELLISHSLGGAAYTNPVTITSAGAMKCSEVLSGLSVTYGNLIFGTATTPTVVSRNTADAYDAFTVNNLNASSTGKLINLQWQSTDRAWFTKEGFLKIESAMNLGTTSTDGLVLANTSPALVGTTVQYSPRLRLRGSAWDVDDAVSRTTDWVIENVPVSGNTVSSSLYFRHSLDGGAYADKMVLPSTGALYVSGGFVAPGGSGIANVTSSVRGAFYIGDIGYGNKVSRNLADAYATFTVDNINVGSTGLIADFQWQSVSKASINRFGGYWTSSQSAFNMGGAIDPSACMTVGWNNSTMAAGTTAARHMIIGGNITELAGAAITDIVGLYINTYTITAGAGATVGFTAGLYIPNAPTPGTAPTIGNYAVFVDAGEVRIDGEIGDTTNRVLKGWFTDLTVTNPIAGTVGVATNLAGGNNTTLLGSIPYQSDSNTTTLLAPNTTATRKVLSMTGDGTNGAAPVWSDDVSYWAKASTVLSPATANDSLDVKINLLGGSTADGIVLSNNTSTASSGLPIEASPRLRFRGHAEQPSTHADETQDWTIYNLPQSFAPTSSKLMFSVSINGATYTDPMVLTSDGALTILSTLTCPDIYLSGNIVTSSSAFYGTFATATNLVPMSVTRNWNDAVSAFAVNLGAAASTGFILELQAEGTAKAWFEKDGGLVLTHDLGDTSHLVPSGYFTYLKNSTDKSMITFAANNISIARNNADAYSALHIDLTSATSTGNILELQWQTDTRSMFNKYGNLGIGIAPSQAIDIYSGAIRSSFGTPGACTATLKDATPGDIDNGDHIYKIVFVNALGQTIGGTASNTVTVTDKTSAGQIDLTGIPVSHDLACTARKVYRTKAGGSDYFLVDTIANNTDTTYTDNTADASLVTAMNTVGTDSGVFFAGTTEWGRINSTASQFKYTCDIATAADKAVILGDGVTEGDWRMIRDGNNLVMQRLESSTWVVKQTVSA